jgi:hypothetical protein
MPDWKKFGYKIAAKKSGDEEWTPLTIPMARLVEYLADLAAMLGHEDHVHLRTVEDGSTQPIVYMHPEVYEAAIAQMHAAQRGEGPDKANAAYRRINDRLITDNGIAEFVDIEKKAKILEFPGRNLSRFKAIKPIREQASISGELRRVGGVDKSIHLLIKRADGEIVSVETDEKFAKQLEKDGWLFKYIRLHGIATWSRDETGKWHMDKFKAQSYDPEPLISETFEATLNALKDVPGNKWNDLKDPFGELRKIRHGDDEPTQ